MKELIEFSPELHLVELPVMGTRKKRWALGMIHYNEDAEPVAFKELTNLAADKDDWYAVMDELRSALFYRTKYRLVRGKLKEIT